MEGWMDVGIEGWMDVEIDDIGIDGWMDGWMEGGEGRWRRG